MFKKISFFSIIFAAIIIFLGINIVAKNYLSNLKYDFTEEKIFTTSNSTKNFLENIQEPLTIKLFYTNKLAQDLPVFQNYYSRIENMLSEYEALSNGMIKVEKIEPEPFSEAEDIAVSHGVEGITVNAAGSKFYFGASVENSIDERKTIAFFDPERAQFLEYDLTKMLDSINNFNRKKVGLLSYLPVRGSSNFQTTGNLMSPRPEWEIVNQIEERFEVTDIQKNAAFIPDDIDILLLIHPHNLSIKNYFAVEQFLLRGGKALIFMDSNVNFSQQAAITSDFSKLFDYWGIEFSDNMIATSKKLAINVQTLSESSRLQSYPKISWLEITGDNLSKNSVITSPLQKIRMIDSGFFKAKNNVKLKFTPLITTGKSASVNKVDINNQNNPENSLELFNNFVPQGESLTLAAQISGNIDALIKINELNIEDENLEKILQQRYIEKSKQPINLILVADTDMLRNEFWARIQQVFGQKIIVPESDNAAFMLNSLDLLSGDDFLINLRTRGNKLRRFTVLDNMKKQAAEKFQREENRLKSKLTQLEQRLKELQLQQNENGKLFTDSQTEEISSFKQIFLQTRKDLRAVQHQLNSKIDKLGNRLALLNIFLVPLLISIVAIFLPAFLRKRHTKKYR